MKIALQTIIAARKPRMNLRNFTEINRNKKPEKMP